MKNIKALNDIVLLAIFLSLFSCGMENESLLEALLTDEQEAFKTKKSAVIDPSLPGEKTIAITEEKSKIYGASLIFPEGSLAKENTAFTLNLRSGQTEISTQVLSDLATKDIASVKVESHYPSLLIYPSKEVKVSAPFTITVPLSDLNLYLVDNLDRFALFYRIYDFGEKKIRSGLKVKPSISFTDDGKYLKASFSHFGIYQAALLQTELKSDLAAESKNQIIYTYDKTKVEIFKVKLSTSSTSSTTNFDKDSDSIADSLDNCPKIANQDQADLDGDDKGDPCDEDKDGDGVLNTKDAFPLNAAESLDTDQDGTGDNTDTDKDGDGVLNAQDLFPLNASESADTDEDGIGNNADNCPDDANPNQEDADNDNIGDTCDLNLHAGPSWTDWKMCGSAYEAQESVGEVPNNWAEYCKEAGSENKKVRLACGASTDHFRYIEISQNPFLGTISYPTSNLIVGSSGQELVDINAGQTSTMAIQSNRIYNGGGGEVDVDTSWWAGSNGCSQTTNNLSINNSSCSWEISACFGLNLTGPRYLWVYIEK